MAGKNKGGREVRKPKQAATAKKSKSEDLSSVVAKAVGPKKK
jgi:hypothetical protein